MKEPRTFTTTVGGKTLTIEVSSLAEQANAAVLAKYGDTVVLVTAVMGRQESSANYMPLKVDYEERFYAAGKIIGSRFVRREGRPSEEAMLSARLVDRTIRPLFDHRLRRDIQVVVTVLAIDEENDPDFVGLIGASSALSISNIPWNGPVGGIRVAKIGNDFVINPTVAQIAGHDCQFETFAAGPKGKINMIEMGALDASEPDVLKAFEIAQPEIDKLVAFQNEIVKEIGTPKVELPLAVLDEKTQGAVNAFLAGKLEGAMYQSDKVKREADMSQLAKDLVDHITAWALEQGEAAPKVSAGLLGHAFEEAVDALVHKNILEKNQRPDGRAMDEVRPLSAQVGLFERTHGSGLFVRGNTQVLSVVTLAPPGAEQLVETMEVTGKRHFMLHYNFPSYSVGEIGSFRGPGRREIGHGALARKALERLIPTRDEFPYTIRVVAETLSSNGSSSMATVCASTLSLMDAGVPIKKPAAGIAMGVIMKDEHTFKVLTDIQGPEDHYGDMDFKVAGTADGITALQLDTKVEGITLPVITQTLKDARAAREKILNVLHATLDAPRVEVSKHAPLVVQHTISPDKIGLVIGPGGKTINGYIAKYALAGIDIEEDGRIFISGTNRENVQRAVEDIRMLTREIAVGEIVEGTVVKILEFGAIVDLGGGQDGMIHVSELKEGFTKDVKEVLKIGDFVRAKVIRVEDGRIGLSLKQLQSARE